MSTVFSDILSGKAEVSFVYRDKLVSAFMDIEPVNRGHVLVVPNKSGASISDLDDETGARIFNVAKKIASAIRQSDLPCDGINFYLADGEAAGQEVFHVHLHVVPRVKGDGFYFLWNPPYLLFSLEPPYLLKAHELLGATSIPTPLTY